MAKMAADMHAVKEFNAAEEREKHQAQSLQLAKDQRDLKLYQVRDIKQKLDG